MEFRIADTFTASLTRLTSQEQKAVKTTAFDLQLNPASSDLRFHRLDHVKDHNAIARVEMKFCWGQLGRGALNYLLAIAAPVSPSLCSK
ncbi:MAG: hypothetical protein KME47_25700 [Nodosilinea sp. WJT8-NPBG4]|jgi:hypothetical protein|nr:hypothetical protein [Nodosilinea sp. WJT8-NPBG4]